MLKNTLLIAGLLLIGCWGTAQSEEVLIERLKAEIKEATIMEGRTKGVVLAMMGHDYIAPGNSALEKLVFETYYAEGDDYLDVYESYEEETYFNISTWSPDGEQLAIGLSDGTIRIYDASDINSYKSINISSNYSILSIDWSPDGSRIAYGSNDNELGIWDVSTNSKLHSWRLTDFVRSVAWSPDGNLLLCGGDDKLLHIYDVESKQEIHSFRQHTDWVRHVAWSGDGERVAAAADDATVTVWSLTENRLLIQHQNHTDYCRAVAFDPSGKGLVSCSDDKNIYVYNNAIDTSPSKNIQGHGNWVMTVDWSDDGQYIASGDAGGAIVVSSKEGEEQQFYNSVTPETAWGNLDFSPTGTTLAATSMHEVAIYELGQAQPRAQITLDGAFTKEGNKVPGVQLDQLFEAVLPYAQQLFFSPNKEMVAIINADYAVDVIDINKEEIAYQITGHADWVRNIAWSDDGQYIATASDDKMVGIWGAKTGEMVQLLSGHTDWVRDVDFSPDGTIVVSAADDGYLKYWDVTTGDLLAESNHMNALLMKVEWSPRQQFVSAISSEGRLSVWNTNNNNLLYDGGEIWWSMLEWKADDEVTVIDVDGTIQHWTPSTGLEKIEGEYGVSISNGKGVKATVKDNYIIITGNKKVLLEGHSANVMGLEWSPDAQYLFSQDAAGILGIWDVSQAKNVAFIPLSTDVVAVKNILWLNNGKCYIPGVSSDIMLPVSRFMTAIDRSVYDIDNLTIDDVLRYDLHRIFLVNEAVKQRLLDSDNKILLSVFADYLEHRASIQPVETAKLADEKDAMTFRTAANK